MIKLKIATLLILSVVLLTNCKKGKDDKFLSLLSRDHRIAGTWRLTKGTIINFSIDKVQSNFYTANSVTFSGDEIYNANMTTDNTFIIKIKKDGTTELTFDNTLTNNSWHWTNSAKNKTGVHLPISGIAWAVTDPDFILDRLTNKEMHLSLTQVEQVFVIINNVNTIHKYGTIATLEFVKKQIR